MEGGGFAAARPSIVRKEIGGALCLKLSDLYALDSTIMPWIINTALLRCTFNTVKTPFAELLACSYGTLTVITE